MLERHHRRALARELTYAAGFPLRDRYGFAASDKAVDLVVSAVFSIPDDVRAADTIGMAVALGEAELASEYDMPTDEEYEAGIVAALRPLVAQRRAAAMKSPGDRPPGQPPGNSS